jgi:hypothetical protein
MAKAQRPIDHREFTAIPRIREMMRTLPEEDRICSEHGEEVIIQESEFLPHPGAGAPFAKAAFVGCCDAVIDKTLEGLRKSLGNM